MAEQKIIAVVGATGAQGGGLVRAILSDVNSGFSARALTRNPSSDKATELARLGADVVAADLDEIESLKRAFEAPTAPSASPTSGSTSPLRKN